MEEPEKPGLADVQNDPVLGFEFRGIYGWVALILAVGFFIIWKKVGEPHIQKRQQSRSLEAEMNKKDDEASLARERAIEESRQRLQAQMDAAAEQHREKLIQREEAKRQERILLYENMKKGKSSNGSMQQDQTDSSLPKQKKPKSERLRGDYNPLIGSSSGSCFRPSRRGGGSSGG